MIIEAQLHLKPTEINISRIIDTIMIKFHGAVFILNHYCNLTCDHCFSSCGPKRNKQINLELIKRTIDDLGTIDQVGKNIGIVGGEPLLFPVQCVELLKYANKKCFQVSITTNGFWGSSKKSAVRILNKLIDAGLGKIEISIDVFHQKYVPVTNIQNIIEASTNYRLDSIILRIHTHKRANTADSISGLCLEKVNHCSIISAPCKPLGRANKNISENDFFYNSVEELIKISSPCIDNTFLTIDSSSGDVYPCCSGSEISTNLSIGNIKKQKISSIINSLENDILINLIMSCSPLAFLTPLYNKGILSFSKKRYVDICDLCVKIFSNDLAYKAVNEYIKEKREFVIDNFYKGYHA